MTHGRLTSLFYRYYVAFFPFGLKTIAMNNSFSDFNYFSNIAHDMKQVPAHPRSQSSSPYKAFLASPFSAIACNVPERADVTFAAILGYN
jgi:hypothetical protein